MLVVTGNQMKQIDNTALAASAIHSLKLMENAGKAAYEDIIGTYDLKNKNVLIICGAGNNGGDGYVIGRKLKKDFLNVKILSTVEFRKLSEDAEYNYKLAKDLGLEIEEVNSIEDFKTEIGKANLIIDAMLGTGIKRDVTDKLKEIFTIINESQKTVVAIDIPSGIGADDGKIWGSAIKAERTITFQLPKLGCIFYPGAEFVGKLEVKDIGINNEIIASHKIFTNLLNMELVSTKIKSKAKTLHKGQSGRVAIIAGSKGMAGAAVLSCKGALRSGAGLVKAVIPEDLLNVIQISSPETICSVQLNSNKGKLGLENIENIISEIKSYDAVVIGPGIGQSESNSYLIKNIIAEFDKPILIDADGLNSIKDDKEIFKNRDNSIVITPHLGEMARLTGLDKAYIYENKIKVASEYSVANKIAVVLKSERTVIAYPDGEVYINTSGNPGMATAGSGDVLTGIIGSFLAQGIVFKDAVNVGVYIHGLSGDIMAEEIGEYGLIASDIALGSGKAIKKVLANKKTS